MILAATLKPDDLLLLDAWGIAFIVAVMVLARPVAVFLSLVGTTLTWPERTFVAWVAPRGVVAVAISGFFGQRLVDIGYPDGELLAPLAFALVAVTVVVHGFSMRPLARVHGSDDQPTAGRDHPGRQPLDDLARPGAEGGGRAGPDGRPQLAPAGGGAQPRHPRPGLASFCQRPRNTRSTCTITAR